MKTRNKDNRLYLILLLLLPFMSCERFQDEEQLVPLTVDQNVSLPSITVNGSMLHSEAFGNPQNPMLVLLHGGPGDDYRSILNAKNFANDDFYVVFYDQRGSGLSQRHDESEDVFNIDTFINDLDGVIQHYKTSPSQKVIIIGHSWGAMLAAAYTNVNLNLTDGLILIEPGGFTWDHTEEYLRRWMKMDLRDETVNDLVYVDQLISGDTHEILDYKATSTPSFDHLLGNPGITSKWRHGAICNKKMIEFAQEQSFDFTANLPGYDKQVLFLYSENNDAYGFEHAQVVAEPFTNIEIKEVKNSGHGVIEFAWDSFYSLVLPFLNQL